MTAEVTKVPCAPLVGADVEAFLYNGETGRYEPCVGILPGTKEKPHQLAGLKKGHAMQEDNVMVEFNIPPCASYMHFTDAITRSKNGVKRYLTKMYPDKDYDLAFMSDMQFRPSELKSEQAQVIGCEPDFDAYQGGEMRTQIPPLGVWRGAGGHVHLGGDFQCPDFVAALFADLFIGVYAGTVGRQPERRSMWYGKPGIFRPKPYGIEYRSPGGAWAGSKHTIMNVGSAAHKLARWLTETDAKTLQTVFRKINWADVRSVLIYNQDLPPEERESFRQNVIGQAQNAGASL